MCGFEPSSAGLLGCEGALPAGLDDPGDPLEHLGREHGPQLHISSLVVLNAGDGPKLLEQAWAVGVDGEVLTIEPLDPPVNGRG